MEIWITTIISLLIGYLLGRGVKVESPIDAIRQHLLPSRPSSSKTGRVGAIKQPTAQDLYDRQHPEIKEGNEAFKELIDKELIR